MHRSTPSVLPTSILTLVLILTTATIALAAPMYGEPWELRQPDGTMVSVLIWGDEYYQVVESLDGYTLIRDPSNQVICYARLSANGYELESTGVRVGSVSPVTLGIPQHIRIDRNARDIEVQKARDAAGAPKLGLEGPIQTALSGNVLGLVLIVDFSDQVATIPQSDVDDFCNDFFYNDNGNNGSVRTYFSDVSDEALDYESWVMPEYYRAGQPFTYYDDCAEPWLARGINLMIEVLDSLDTAGHDFSVYDADGDMVIDAINFFYAGSTGCGWAKGMWPGSGGIGGAWVSSGGYAADRFQFTGMGAGLTIGTYCHENGHMVGHWPDLYDYDGDSRGVGLYCIMASGGSATNPIEPCAFLKQEAGWGPGPTVIAAPQSGITVGPSSDNDNVFKFVNPGNAKEYFLVENRIRTGRDVAVGDDGLIWYHIDEDGDHNANEMTMLSHFLVTVVQADGLWDLEMDVNSGDSDDGYGAPDYTALTPCTNPGTEWWDNSASGFNFNNMSAKGTEMTFDFSLGDDPPVMALSSFGLDADGDCCIEVSVDDVDNGISDPQGPGDIESILITEVDGSPVTPAETVEVCGAGPHTIEVTATDLCGNQASGVVGVTVQNETPVTLCKSFSAEADTNCCIKVGLEDIDDGSYDPDGAGDIKSFGITAIDGNPVALTDTVEVCGNGWHTVTLTMTDWCDSTSSCDADVEVIDVTPPELTVTLSRDCLWPPNHKYVMIGATVEVTDNCDPDPAWVLESITSNEPDNGKGDGNTINDIAMADTGTADVEFKLRSERSAKGEGRTYTIVYRAWDESGNVTQNTTEVFVPHDMGHGAICATGFTSSGAGFLDGARTFAIIIPSSEAEYSIKGHRETLVKPAVIATDLDLSRAYVGNTAGAIRPLKSKVVDINDDGLDDIALFYDASSATQIKTISEAALAIGEIWDGPVGLHFMGQDGTPYLVNDIFALGTPVALHEDDGDPGYEREGDPLLDLTPGADVSYENGIASIFPNPFNPATTVRFTLADAGDVTISVYDVSGALVRVLVDEYMSSGEHTAAWDGTDLHGNTVATGVYFARMTAGSFEMTRKMVLVK